MHRLPFCLFTFFLVAVSAGAQTVPRPGMIASVNASQQEPLAGSFVGARFLSSVSRINWEFVPQVP